MRGLLLLKLKNYSKMKIQKFEDFLSNELVIELESYIEKLRNDRKTIFTTNLTMWEKNLLNTSTAMLRYDFGQNETQLLNKIKKEVENKIPYYVSNVVLHLFPPLSYITWHNDGHVNAAFTLYMNREWDDNWGGYLMYKKDNEIMAIKPEYNLGVLQEKGVLHCVSTVNIGSDYRISLQFFLTKQKSIL